MTVLHRQAISIVADQPLPDGTRLSVEHSPSPLFQFGFLLPVEIAIAEAFRDVVVSSFQAVTVKAVLDTGATITSIDINVAQYLNLQVTGWSRSLTASGSHEMPSFAVDVSFPGTKLRPFYNLQIGSCNLDFKLNTNDPQKSEGLGLLIGRDMMTRWNIVWNGPSSTVIICD